MGQVRGSFTRRSPSSFAENVGIPVGWFVISWRMVPEKGARRKLHGRLFKISCGDRKVYRILRFSTHLRGSRGPTNGEVVIDWPAWLELSDFAEESRDDLELLIEPAPRWHLWRLAFSHPDPAYRLAAILGLVSVGLGFLSLFLAFAAFG